MAPNIGRRYLALDFKFNQVLNIILSLKAYTGQLAYVKG